jgi:hypothetical protein
LDEIIASEQEEDRLYRRMGDDRILKRRIEQDWTGG